MKYRVEWSDQQCEIEATRDPLGREWKFVLPDGVSIDARVEILEEGSVVRLITAGESHTVSLLPGNRPGEPVRFLLDHTPVELDVLDPVDLITREVSAGSSQSGHEKLHSVMPGIVRKLLVKEGDEVQEGDPLLLLEAMKMENEITSPVAGTVVKIEVKEGEAVAAGSLLLIIDS